MGSSEGKGGGGTNWNEVAYGLSDQHYAGGGSRESMSSLDPNYAPGGKYAAAADLAWGKAQQTRQAQTAQQDMFNSFMTQMMGPTGAGGSEEAPVSAEEQSARDWRGTGQRESTTDFATISKQLGDIEEGQSYVFDTDLSDGSAKTWRIRDTPDFSPGYTGEGYTGGGVSFAEGFNLRDEAIGSFTESLGKASSYVDQQISHERSNALLMGVDYNFSQEARDTRVGGALVDFGWGDSQQSDLDEILGKWGSSGFQQQIFGNATGSGIEGGEAAAKTTAPKSGISTMPLTDDDTLSETSLLGG